jgi:eukaryotic-like serine/threonine-protein kinase
MHVVSTRMGRYELLCELGQGGMAKLYLARLHGVHGFARPVALKLILPHLATERTFVEQFLNEGRIAARLSHPNVCQVYELGEEDAQLYLAMEYLAGVPWDELVLALPDEITTRVRFTAGVLAQAFDGLQHAHEQHVIHRDVSPTNMFVTVDGVCKVLDFGVSKLLTDGKHTRTGVLKGKLPYMSPEQIEGAPIDARSDVFAAGVCIWEAIAGTRLFDRSTDFQIWKAITEEDVPSLGHDDLDAILARALARAPAERTPSMRVLSHELCEVAGVYGGAASQDEIAQLVGRACATQIASRAALVHKASSTITTVDEPEPSATVSMAMRGASLVIDRPRRAKWPLVAAGLVVAAAAAVLVVTTRDRPPAKQIAAAAPSVDAAAVVVDAAPVEPPMVDAQTLRKKSTSRVKATLVAKETPPVEARAPGMFSIASKPFARIYVDGTYVDQTPIYRHRIAAGPHTIRAVLEDGREKTFRIVVASEAEVNSGTLQW